MLVFIFNPLRWIAILLFTESNHGLSKPQTLILLLLLIFRPRTLHFIGYPNKSITFTWRGHFICHSLRFPRKIDPRRRLIADRRKNPKPKGLENCRGIVGRNKFISWKINWNYKQGILVEFPISEA